MKYTQLSIFILSISFIFLNSCSKTENITYDVHFWSPETVQETLILIVDGKEEGILVKQQEEIDCNSSDSILNQLITLSLSSGNYSIDVRNELDEIKKIGTLNIKNGIFQNSIGISSSENPGELKIFGGEECLTVMIAI